MLLRKISLLSHVRFVFWRAARIEWCERPCACIQLCGVSLGMQCHIISVYDYAIREQSLSRCFPVSLSMSLLCLQTLAVYLSRPDLLFCFLSFFSTCLCSCSSFPKAIYRDDTSEITINYWILQIAPTKKNCKKHLWFMKKFKVIVLSEYFCDFFLSLSIHQNGRIFEWAFRFAQLFMDVVMQARKRKRDAKRQREKETKRGRQRETHTLTKENTQFHTHTHKHTTSY